MAELALVLFDVDGTIFDSQQVILAGFNQAFHSLNITPPSDADILNTVGLSLPNAIGRMKPELDGVEIERVTQAYRDSFQTIGKAKVPFYAGIEAIIHQLAAHDHLIMGIATGKSRRGLDPLLRDHGLDDVFKLRQTADFFPSKPHPEMIIDAQAQYDIDPKRCVFIGDTSYDIDMAKAAGIRSIGVRWGYHGNQMDNLGADAIAAEAKDIVTTLENWEFL